MRLLDQMQDDDLAPDGVSGVLLAGKDHEAREALGSWLLAPRATVWKQIPFSPLVSGRPACDEPGDGPTSRGPTAPISGPISFVLAVGSRGYRECFFFTWQFTPPPPPSP